MNNAKYSHHYTRTAGRFCFTVFLSLTLCACGIFTDGVEPAIEDGTSSESPKAETSTEPKALSVEQMPATSDIEVLWAIPEDPVDRFILRYGFSKENLDKELVLFPLDLKTLRNQQYGEAFRYVISGMPKDKTVFLTLSSAKGEEVSKPTEVFEVRPQQ